MGAGITVGIMVGGHHLMDFECSVYYVGICREKYRYGGVPWVNSSVVLMNGIEPLGDLGLFVVGLHGCHPAML